jgi:hypothetical protein
MDLVPLALNILKSSLEPRTAAFLITLAFSGRIWRLCDVAVELVVIKSQKSMLVEQSMQLSRKRWGDLFDRFYFHALLKLCNALGAETLPFRLTDAFKVFAKPSSIYWVYLGTALTLPLSYYLIHWFLVDWYSQATDVSSAGVIIPRSLVLLFTIHQIWFLIDVSQGIRPRSLLLHILTFIANFLIVLAISRFTEVTREPLVNLFYFSYAPIVPVLFLAT